MPATLSPRTTRQLAERLIAIPSVSPDPAAETACAAVIRATLPAGVTTGEWCTIDGRPVVWGHLPGASPRTVVLLTHYDTVGVSEFVALGDAAGERLAFDPFALRARLLALDPSRLPPEVAADLDQERREPGTWLFGRGALDMKSGIAAGIAALEALAGDATRQGGVLFLACPDEEHQSAGMLRAVPELDALRGSLDFRGALNLDYVESATAYDGVVGKVRIGLFVLGAPTHVGKPFGGADATQIAAALVGRLTTASSLVESAVGGVPPVALGMRDLKTRYDAQTALEAEVELNLLLFERSLADAVERLKAESAAALEELAARMSELARAAGHAPPTWGEGRRVWTYAELESLAGRAAGDVPLGHDAAPTDPRLATRERVRRLVRAAGLAGPAVVLTALPPYYPRSAPRAGGLGERLRPWLERQGVRVEPFYRFISDASYLAWRADAPAGLETMLPALGREYALPIAECRALDLDVVTLGPWGRDAHGLFERVHAGDAFETLPRWIAGAAREAVRAIGEAP